MEQFNYILGIKMIGDETYDIFLLKEGEIVSLEQNESNRRESMEVLDVLDRVLQEAGITIQDISLISVMHGRGSFTSNRLGAITANTLGYTLQIPVIGIEIKEDSETTPEHFVNLIENYLNNNTVQLGEYINPTYSG